MKKKKKSTGSNLTSTACCTKAPHRIGFYPYAENRLVLLIRRRDYAVTRLSHEATGASRPLSLAFDLQMGTDDVSGWPLGRKPTLPECPRLLSIFFWPAFIYWRALAIRLGP